MPQMQGMPMPSQGFGGGMPGPMSPQGFGTMPPQQSQSFGGYGQGGQNYGAYVPPQRVKRAD
jgi:hypothetical protein